MPDAATVGRGAVTVRVPLRARDGGGACGARVLVLPSRGGEAAREAVVVVRRTEDGQVRALSYVNRCPHAGYGLDVGDDEVCDPSGRWLMCMVHGALFRPEDGAAVRGAALGSSLTPLGTRTTVRLEVTPQGTEAVVTVAPCAAPPPA